MSGSAHEVVSALTRALGMGQHAYLATVMRTYGSSPRPAGSMMMYAESTGVVGSVSGGCIEDDVISQIKAGTLANSAPCQLTYGNSESLARDARFALPCGGELSVLVERISAASVGQWQQLEQALAYRTACLREVDIKSGDWQFEPLAACGDRLNEGDLQQAQGLTYRYRLGPERKLLIVGANPTARVLASLAASLDFAVTICDPSEHLGGVWYDSDAFEFRACYPDGFIARDFGDSASAIVALSHDPRLDDMALLEALVSNAFYIGAMGSAATSAARRARLAALGVPDNDLMRLRAPIGFNIGSKTPAEIAISIAAELVSAYTGHKL